MRRAYDDEGWSQAGDLPVGSYAVVEYVPMTAKQEKARRRKLRKQERRRVPIGFRIS